VLTTSSSVLSSSSSYSYGPSSYPVGPSGNPHPSGSYVPSHSGSPPTYGNCTTTYSSVCTETETLIYRSTTEYVPTTITHIFTTSLPGASCSGVLYPVTSSSTASVSSSTPYSPEQPGTSSSTTPTSPEQPSGTPGFPSCWADCFSKNGVGSQDVACENEASHQCIKDSCSAADAAAFESWLTTDCGSDGSSSSTPVSPEQPTGYTTTETDVTTIYTTVCPYTETKTDGESTYTTTYDTTSEVTTTYVETITVPGDYGNTLLPSEPVATPTGGEGSPTGGESTPTGGAGSPGGGYGTPSEYTTINPVTKPFTYGDWTSYYTDFETSTLTSYVTETAPASVPTGDAGVPTGGEGSPTGGYGTQTLIYSTPVTTVYTTICTATDSEGLTTSTVTTTSTIDITLTVTDYPVTTTSSTSGGAIPPYPLPSTSSSIGGGYPTGGYGTGTAIYPTGGTGTGTSPAGPPTGHPSVPDCWSQCFGEYGVTSPASLCNNLDVDTCIKASCPADSYSAYEGWVVDYCGAPTTSSGIVGPTGSGYPQPTGSGSVSTSSKPSGTIGTTSSSTSETCSTPTPTKDCKRCEGQPGDDKWCGLGIDTNIYGTGNYPITCDTVEYDFEITTGNVSPDGVERWAILVNGQSPGPAIQANWGDEIIVHVKNSMPESDLNGTTIHWHGIHQYGTPEFDGVPSLSQCPIAPGETYTYKFRASQFGSTWYHSHFALQAYDGLFGPLIIDGPTQEGIEYDGEEFIALQDWSHKPLNFMYHALELVQNGQRSSPTLENGLINGKNTYEAGGERWSMTVTKGKTYRLRVLNAAIQSTFKFYIDGHKFTVIAADLVPIVPYETNIINVNNGQRYDVIFTADQDSANYWMRADNQQPCSNITNGLDIKAILHYDDAPDRTPESTAYTYTPECVDEAPENLVPVVPWNAGTAASEIDKDVVIQPNGGNPNLFKWTLSGTAFFSQWSDPTLMSIYEDGTVPTYSGDLAIREDNLGEWIYVVIDSPIPLPHPIHLHGHDFLVLDQGFGLYNAATASLNLNNPPRRDTAIMPFQPGTVGGYLVVAFYTDNPGVWLMHCHIGWHNAMGFALQIIEGLEEIKETVEYACQNEDNCDAWHAYAEEYDIIVTDSGI